MKYLLPQTEGDILGGRRVDRVHLLLGLAALVFALGLMGQAAAKAGSSASDTVCSPVDHHDGATTPDRAAADHLAGVPRSNTRWVLRFGKHLRTFFVAFGGDDPNDNETSDDPTDDDDGWEGLKAVQVTAAPVFAWFQKAVSYQSDLEPQSGPSWSGLPFFTSFLKLQRLRC